VQRDRRAGCNGHQDDAQLCGARQGEAAHHEQGQHRDRHQHREQRSRQQSWIVSPAADLATTMPRPRVNITQKIVAAAASVSTRSGIGPSTIIQPLPQARGRPTGCASCPP